MAVVKLTQDLIAHGLHCPAGKQRDELVDDQRTGLYIEVRIASPGQGTYYLRYKMPPARPATSRSAAPPNDADRTRQRRPRR
ncbi:MAG: hypothetical protein IPI03_18975 [Rubrivivax sp.]|nr:hypothetical protein [Rubrivivax sp.]